MTTIADPLDLMSTAEIRQMARSGPSTIHRYHAAKYLGARMYPDQPKKSPFDDLTTPDLYEESKDGFDECPIFCAAARAEYERRQKEIYFSKLPLSVKTPERVVVGGSIFVRAT